MFALAAARPKTVERLSADETATRIADVLGAGGTDLEATGQIATDTLQRAVIEVQTALGDGHDGEAIVQIWRAGDKLLPHLQKLCVLASDWISTALAKRESAKVALEIAWNTLNKHVSHVDTVYGRQLLKEGGGDDVQRKLHQTCQYAGIDIRASSATMLQNILVSHEFHDASLRHRAVGATPTRNTGGQAASGRPVSLNVSFRNRSNQHVNLFWLSDTNEAHLQSSMAPGDSHTRQTWTGHRFFFREDHVTEDHVDNLNIQTIVEGQPEIDYYGRQGGHGSDL